MENIEGTAPVDTGEKLLQYVKPIKRIKTNEDVATFTKSTAYMELVEFIVDLAESVKQKEIPIPNVMQYMAMRNATSDEGMSDSIAKAATTFSDAILGVLQLLWELYDAIEKFPPVQQRMRFGNKAFQNWQDYFTENNTKILEKCLPESMHPAICELSAYLSDSFGNRTRIDYGTGHELAFCQFLFCLFKLKYLNVEDRANTVLVIFKCYLELMRKLQTIYRLEPAGSRGVWGLDDYHFLPFLWGAAQLEDHDTIKPSDVINTAIVKQYCNSYLYLDAIQFIMETKKNASFAECAPILYDISAVSSWSKTKLGMVKMYQAEVLHKFPVVQHTLFGCIIPFQ